MKRIFLSYRRDDSQATAGRIAEHLAHAFGSEAIFQDVEALRPGKDFRAAITEALDKSGTVLVLIGRHWLSASSPTDGRRRLDNADDFVRSEIEQALQSGKSIVPVLVDGAAMPSADALPESIRALAYRNAVEVRPGRDFQHDMQRLIEALQENKLSYARAVSYTKPPSPDGHQRRGSRSAALPSYSLWRWSSVHSLGGRSPLAPSFLSFRSLRSASR